MQNRLRFQSFFYFSLGIFLIFLCNWPLFTTRVAVNWDAFDWLWPYFRWYGSALRDGYFPDFFPNILSGYPSGSNIQSGLYNPLYLTFAFLFPDSVLSINLLYLSLIIIIFSLSFAIAKTFFLSSLTSLYFSLAISSSGFVIGHASHIPFLSTYGGLLSIFLGLRYGLLNKYSKAFIAICGGIFFLLTAGYPQNIFFGGLCLAFYWIYLFFGAPKKPSFLLVTLGSALIGGVLAIPSLWHFTNLLLISSRGNGLSPIAAMQNSLPSYSLLNFFYAPWKMGFFEPTMERFHLLWISGLLIGLALWDAIINKALRGRIILLISLAALLTLLSLGGNGIFPIRLWLAEHLFIFRTSRHPSAEHSGIALFIFALITAFALDRLQLRFKHLSIFFLILISIDFYFLQIQTQDIRFSNIPTRYQGKVPLFITNFNSENQSLVDFPRICISDGIDAGSTALWAERDLLAPNGFYWNAFEGLRDQTYESERVAAKSLLCAPSRLIESSSQEPYPYQLILYSPGAIKFKVLGNAIEKPVKLIWADYNDGFWRLKINGQPIEIQAGPAKTRIFEAKSGDTIEMRYLGPLSQLWR
jgi:hypothetical protein